MSKSGRVFWSDKLGAGMLKWRSVIAWLFCLGWWQVFTDKNLAQNSCVALLTAFSLYGMSCFAIAGLRRTQAELHFSARFAVGVIAIFFIFLAWGWLIGQLPGMDFFKALPKGIKVALLLLNGPAIAVAIGFFLPFPLCSVMRKGYWVPPLIASCLITWVEFLMFSFSDKKQPIIYWVLASELFSLLVILPVSLWGAHKLTAHMRPAPVG